MIFALHTHECQAGKPAFNQLLEGKFHESYVASPPCFRATAVGRNPLINLLTASMRPCPAPNNAIGLVVRIWAPHAGDTANMSLNRYALPRQAGKPAFSDYGPLPGWEAGFCVAAISLLCDLSYCCKNILLFAIQCYNVIAAMLCHGSEQPVLRYQLKVHRVRSAIRMYAAIQNMCIA